MAGIDDVGDPLTGTPNVPAEKPDEWAALEKAGKTMTNPANLAFLKALRSKRVGGPLKGEPTQKVKTPFIRSL